MIAELKDAIVCLGLDIEPIAGTLKYRMPYTPNRAVTIKTDNKTILLKGDQVKLAMFKLTNNEFGFIFRNGAYSSNEVSYWDKETIKLVGRKLKPCFTH